MRTLVLVLCMLGMARPVLAEMSDDAEVDARMAMRKFGELAAQYARCDVLVTPLRKEVQAQLKRCGASSEQEGSLMQTYNDAFSVASDILRDAKLQCLWTDDEAQGRFNSAVSQIHTGGTCN